MPHRLALVSFPASVEDFYPAMKMRGIFFALAMEIIDRKCSIMVTLSADAAIRTLTVKGR